MKVVILSRMVYETTTIQSILHSQGCECSTIINLCELEKESRNNVWSFLLLDKDYLQNKNDVRLLQNCLGMLNCKIPIIYFSISDFTPRLANEKIKLDEKILYMLDYTQKKLNTMKTTYDEQLRPAEKKLYSLLKTAKDTPISLEDMSLYLWGVSSSAHTKTLYSYIHRIKQILGENNDNIERIIKEKKGCYKISCDIEKSAATLK